MQAERFERLARELAERDPELTNRIRAAQRSAEQLREQAYEAVDTFTRTARELGATYLVHVEVSPVGPDQKHVDCVQFSVSRGRLMLLCVAIAQPPGKVRLVGPFKLGKVEGPCSDWPLEGPEVNQALEDGIAALLLEAAGA